MWQNMVDFNIQIQSVSEFLEQEKENLFHEGKKVQQVISGKMNDSFIFIFENQQNPNYMVQFYENNLLKYQGYTNEKEQYHGKGKLKLLNQSYYEGDFVENKPHGQSTLIFPNGEYYQGGFLQGVYHGSGVYIALKNGYQIKSQGEWLQGTRNGEFLITNISLDSQPCMVLYYRNGKIVKIERFEGTLDLFGYTNEHFQCIDPNVVLPEIEYNQENLQLVFEQDEERIDQDQDQLQNIFGQTNEEERDRFDDILAGYLVKEYQLTWLQSKGDLRLHCGICGFYLQQGEKIKCFPGKNIDIFHSICLGKYRNRCRLDELNINQIKGDGESMFIYIDSEQGFDFVKGKRYEDQEKNINEVLGIEIEQQSTYLVKQIKYDINQND